MLVRRVFRHVLALALSSVPLLAQDPATVEGRLLEILRENGVINGAQFVELTDLAKELRNEQDFASQVDTHVEAMITALQDAPPITRYRRGRGWSWTRADEKFSLNIGGRIQVRFTHDFWENNPRTDDEDESDFDVKRARVWLQGNAFSKHLRYKVQFDVAGEEADTQVLQLNGATPDFDSDNRLTELKDAFVEYARWDAFRFRMGQFKVPYSRHFLTSSSTLQFVDRSITDKIFVPGRDIGVMVSGRAGGEKDNIFEYYAGVFDGDGENRTNDDHGLMYAGRVAVNPFGGVKYRESDLRHSEQFKLAIGLNAWLHEDDNHIGLKDDWSVGADLAAMWQGFSLLFEIHYREDGRRISHDVEMTGWMAQMGYVIVPRTFEVALRAAGIGWDHNTTGDAGRREYLVVLGYFWHDHDLKTQLDFGRIEDHQGDHLDNKDEWRLRLQLQVVF